MSVVTTILMTSGICDDDKLPLVNRYFETMEFPVSGLVDVNEHAGGSKAPQANVWLGAYNHFDEAPFWEHLKTIKWYDPGAVRIYLNREHDEGFSIEALSLEGITFSEGARSLSEP